MNAVTVNGTSSTTIPNIKKLNKIVAVSMIIPKGLQNVTVKHSGTAMTEATTSADRGQDQHYAYDSSSGELTIWTSSFSPFQISWVKTPTAVVTPLSFSGEPISLLKNDQYANKAALDKAFTFAAFNDNDQSAVDALINVLDGSNFNNWNVDIDDISLDYVNNAINQIEDQALKLRMQQLVEERLEYLGWRADYTISFDHDIAAGSVALGGQYDSFGNTWIGFGVSDFERDEEGHLIANNPITLDKGKELRLLDTMFGVMGNHDMHMNYATICLLVNKFNCGFANLSDENIGTTMTVRLCLHESLIHLLPALPAGAGSGQSA